MPDEEREVNIVERVEVQPSNEEEIQPDDKEKETQSESSPDEKPDQETPKEELYGRRIPSEQAEPKPVEGETPRERALRKEVERVKALNRELKAQELFKGEKVEEVKPVISQDKQKILEKYNPQELENLKEVMGVMADDLGFVKKDEYQKTTYQQTASEALDSFLEKHPAYLPENDTDNVLWSRFKDEFSLYKQPTNPRELKKVFDRIHKDIFGASSDEESLSKINAQREKIKVASHTGTSSNRTSKPSSSLPKLDNSLRDNLQGFTNEELDEMFGE